MATATRLTQQERQHHAALRDAARPAAGSWPVSSSRESVFQPCRSASLAPTCLSPLPLAQAHFEQIASTGMQGSGLLQFRAGPSNSSSRCIRCRSRTANLKAKSFLGSAAYQCFNACMYISFHGADWMQLLILRSQPSQPMQAQPCGLRHRCFCRLLTRRQCQAGTWGRKRGPSRLPGQSHRPTSPVCSACPETA